MNVVYEINRYWVTENVTIINLHFSHFLTIFSCLIESHLATALVFSSTGRRPASLCHGLLSVVCQCVRLSVHPCVNFFFKNLNTFFSETTYRILMKFYRNVPAMVLFRISWKNLILSKTLVFHGNKTVKLLKTLKIFLSETIRVRATKFSM